MLRIAALRIWMIYVTDLITSLLTCHDMFAATNCPGTFLKGKFPELVQLVNGTTTSQQACKKSVYEIAKEVINGKWGNWDDRKN